MIRPDLARGAAELLEPDRRYAVKGLVKDRWRISARDLRRGRRAKAAVTAPADRMAEADIFLAAYADREGTKYWEAWLFEPMSKREFIDLLAAHSARSADEFDILSRQLLKRALVQAPDLCGRAEAEWLLKNPNTEALVPRSLRRWLQLGEPPVDSLRAEAPDVAANDHKTRGTRRKGPVPGTTDKVAQERRKLFPDIKARLERGAKSVTAAVQELKEALLPGNGTLENKRAALVKLYKREQPK